MAMAMPTPMRFMRFGLTKGRLEVGREMAGYASKALWKMTNAKLEARKNMTEMLLFQTAKTAVHDAANANDDDDDDDDDCASMARMAPTSFLTPSHAGPARGPWWMRPGQNAIHW